MLWPLNSGDGNEDMAYLDCRCLGVRGVYLIGTRQENRSDNNTRLQIHYVENPRPTLKTASDVKHTAHRTNCKNPSHGSS